MNEDKKQEVKPGPIVDPDVVAAIKAQVMEELKSEENRAKEEIKKRQEEERKQHETYVEKMKASPEPWVEIVAWTNTAEGLRTELDWNDAFIAYLRENGINGVDDEQVVQKYITLLLYDMAGQIEEESGNDSKFE